MIGKTSTIACGTCADCAKRESCELLKRCLERVDSEASRKIILAGCCSAWEPGAEKMRVTE